MPASPEVLGVRMDDEATSTSGFGLVSDGFPSRAYAGVIPSRDEVDEDEARSLRVLLVFCRGRKTVEAQIRLLR